MIVFKVICKKAPNCRYVVDIFVKMLINEREPGIDLLGTLNGTLQL